MDSLSIYTFLCIARSPKYECFCSDEIKMKMKPRLQRVSAVWVVVVEAPVRTCWRHAGQGVRRGGDGRFSAFKTWGEIGTKYARYQSQPAFGHYMPETPQKPLGKFHKIYCDFPLNCISLALAALFFFYESAFTFPCLGILIKENTALIFSQPEPLWRVGWESQLSILHLKIMWSRQEINN